MRVESNQDLQDIRCPDCNRLLFKATPFTGWQGCRLEIMCFKCGALVAWPVMVAQVESRKEAMNGRLAKVV